MQAQFYRRICIAVHTEGLVFVIREEYIVLSPTLVPTNIPLSFLSGAIGIHIISNLDSQEASQEENTPQYRYHIMADIPDHLPQSLKDSLNGSKAQYVQLGQCGLRVSIPILGCMTFGDRRFYPWALEEEDVRGCYFLPLYSLKTSQLLCLVHPSPPQ